MEDIEQVRPENLCGEHDDVTDFWISQHALKIFDFMPSNEVFLRDVYAAHVPCIIRGGCKDWQATKKWTLKSLLERLGDKTIEVNLTPDGRADAVIDDELGNKVFALPAPVEMKFAEFAEYFYNNSDDAVMYLSQQDDNLTTHFPELLSEIAPLPIAEGAFLDGLAATNLWIGNEKSVTSMHKDHYENFYAVIQGEKVFTLLPPADAIHLDEKEYAVKRWTRKHSHFCLEGAQEHQKVSWLSHDPDYPGHAHFFANTHPIRFTLQQGDVLYLPALWYHRVTQSCTTIAVNYWYEMRFDHRFVFYQLCREMKKRRDRERGDTQEL